MHQFLSKVLRPPLLEASSLMSNPIGPYSLETRLGGFPAAMFWRMILPECTGLDQDAVAVSGDAVLLDR
jgi:hypothetical protein